MVAQQLAPQSEVQQITDPAAITPRWYTRVLKMDDDDLEVDEYRLLGHYRQKCGENGGSCEETTAETARTVKGFTERRVRVARAGLETQHRITTKLTGRSIRITIIDRMADNIARYDKKGLILQIRQISPSKSESPDLADQPDQGAGLAAGSAAGEGGNKGKELNESDSLLPGSADPAFFDGTPVPVDTSKPIVFGAWPGSFSAPQALEDIPAGYYARYDDQAVRHLIPQGKVTAACNKRPALDLPNGSRLVRDEQKRIIRVKGRHTLPDGQQVFYVEDCPTCARNIKEPPVKAPQPHMAPIVAFIDAFGHAGQLPADFNYGSFSQLSKRMASGVSANKLSLAEITCAGKVFAAWYDAQRRLPALKWTVEEVTVNSRLALTLCRRGVTADSVAAFIKKTLEAAFWGDKQVNLQYVADHITVNRPAPTPAPVAPARGKVCPVCGGRGVHMLNRTDGTTAAVPCDFNKGSVA